MMAVKVSAYSEPRPACGVARARGGLRSCAAPSGCQPSAAESCWPTRNADNSVPVRTILGFLVRQTCVNKRTQAVDSRECASPLGVNREGPFQVRCSFATASTAASSWTVWMPSFVVVAIKLACADVAHEARGALSGLSGQRHGRWCHVRDTSGTHEGATLGSLFSRLNHL